MKLYFTPTSPFVRKVLIAAHELGLAGRIEPILLRPAPTKADPVLSKANPLNKIPALLLDDGSALYDSPVICEYLDSLGPSPKLCPPVGPERWRVLRLQALCDGILDAAILVFYERANRPAELHWSSWLDGQSEKARQGLAELEARVSSLEGPVDLGQISAAATLGWLEFRAPLGEIRSAYPGLFAWYDRFRTRPSVIATEPHALSSLRVFVGCFPSPRCGAFGTLWHASWWLGCARVVVGGAGRCCSPSGSFFPQHPPFSSTSRRPTRRTIVWRMLARFSPRRSAWKRRGPTTRRSKNFAKSQA